MFPNQLYSAITLLVPLTVYVASFPAKMELFKFNFEFDKCKLTYTTEFEPVLLINFDSTILFSLLVASETYTASPWELAALLMKVQLIISILFPLKYTTAPLIPTAFVNMIFFKVRLYEFVSSLK